MTSFHNIYRHNFARVAACPLHGMVADPAHNADEVLRVAAQCHAKGVAVAVFPELTLSGYAIDDLVLQDPLLDAVETALARVIQASREWLPVVLVGAPLRHGTRLYNTAVVIHRGQVLGVVPKTFLPNYREFYEKRYFASGRDTQGGQITVAGQSVPFGTDLVFAAQDLPDLRLGVEICEDLWVPTPPSSGAALAGAMILANLSASPSTVGRADARILLCRSQSARCVAAYIYTAAGPGESTNDLSWDGQASIYENGKVLREGARFQQESHLVMADIDLDLLRQERMRVNSFDDARAMQASQNAYRTISFQLSPPQGEIGFLREIDRFPFVPSDASALAEDCFEAYNIQVSGLVQRVRASGVEKLVIGVSGGLDSTHALIVCARAMDLLGHPRENILAYTMPGFATGVASKTYAHRLMEALGVTAHELDIRPAATQMLADLGHPYAQGQAVYDITFENVQAGLRTDYLFRLANHHGAIVVGTGDLSELALGWCTYGVGDQMSHYNVNAGVPKTLIQHLIRWVVSSDLFGDEASAVLEAIVGAEISPELVPVAQGQAPQSTEARIGPYELQDFNLFYTLRYGFRPSRIAFLAWWAWNDAARGAWPAGFPLAARHSYDLTMIRGWLRVFVTRFFGFSQFKRSAMPNGPKVVAGGALSPRGEWRAPSDGNARAWLADLENVPDA